MAEISLDDVRKVYPGGVEAVTGVSLDIADGELIVLVGPSGCGKSTLLRLVAGLETITGGDISIGGQVVNDLEPADRDIAMVFQNYALYPHMSVYNNMAYGLRNRGTAKPEIDERVRTAAKILELDHLLERRPRQLSGGQRQRVAMGRAIVREPAAFLFDEPLSNLDAKLRVQMRVEIKRLQRSLATTSLYVTHDQLEAMTLGDRLVVMNHGQVEQIGTPIDVYEKPASTFVAGFIGSPAMNLLPVSANEAGYGLTQGPGLQCSTKVEWEKMTLGVRPEDLLVTEMSNEAVLSVNLTVTAVEPVGHESFIHGLIGGDGPDIIVRAPGRVHQELGTQMRATATADALHLFDHESGMRLRS